MNKKPIAKLSQGRRKWCVLFFHPKLSDANGRPRRVRYGIGTENREESEKILADLNAILANEDLWSPGAKEIALRSYNPTAVACFYDGIEAKIVDPWIKREEIIELPKEGVSIVQLTGPIGAGKTTLVRQLIGTDPVKERFPATSNSRTTIFDTEIICSAGNYHAVVSFLSPDRVRSDVEECVQAAVMAVAEGLGKDSVARRFLEHSEQKFRLNYILGPCPQSQEENEDADEPLAAREQPGEISEEERQENRTKLVEWLSRCETLAKRIICDLEDEVGETETKMTEKDQDAFLQLVSDKLVDDEDLHTVVDEVVDAIEARFQFFDLKEFDRDSSGWPIRWRYQSENRAEFLKRVRWFASNHAPLFGRLLTPLVEGLRVKGPFTPGWSDDSEIPPIVLLDGVGLGHSRGTGVQISTSVTRRFDLAHAIVVDDATKPMLDAAQALLRQVTASGHERKFAIVFTNFDRMEGDDFGSGSSGRKDKKNKVLAAVEQGILSVETALDVQSGAGRRLRRVLESERVFFVANIDKRAGEQPKSTRKALNALLTFMRTANQPEPLVEVTPCYDLGFLASCIRAATEPFQKYWNGRLGLGYHEGVKAEHWTRVKALSRRFASQRSDEYDTMQPVAHLLGSLKEKLLTRFAASPREWKPSNASTEAKDAAIARVSAEVSKRLEGYVARRMREEHLTNWNIAYSQRDKGSAQRRATYIRSINEDVAAVPEEVPAPIAAKLLDDFRAIFREAAKAAGAEIIAG